MENYTDFVKELVRQFGEAEKLPLKTDESARPSLPQAKSDSLKGKNFLIFAPHPDDECIMGLLPLRLMAECGANIIDVAVTLGSKVERRAERLEELKQACKYLGWGLRVCAGGGGLETVRLASKNHDQPRWGKYVDEVAAIIKEFSPAAIFAPHADDWNATHIGTSYLVSDAAERAKYDGVVVNTEYWGGIREANLMVEASEECVACQMQALARHVKEVERNDYHLRMPAWMSDNVRRGTELVGGQGAAAPKFHFATLYNVLERKGGVWRQKFERKFLPLSEPADIILQ